MALSLQDVLDYATPQVRSLLPHDLPQEHKEEIMQTAYMRLIEAFPSIQEDGGWRSFVYNHCRGAVLDYQKFGKGFQESKWSLASSPDQARTPKLTRRVTVSPANEDDTAEAAFDRALGKEGIFSLLDEDRINIRWELVARMASTDDNLHAFAKYLRGISIEEMAPLFGVVRTRVSQMIQEFVERFDDPKLADRADFKQTCYAFGICRQLGMDDVDQSSLMGGMAMGWKLNPVDLDFIPPEAQDAQMGLFDGEEESSEEEY